MAKRKPEKLTHTFIKSVAKEGRYGDGRGGLGLSLLVQKTKNGRWSKTWSQRLKYVLKDLAIASIKPRTICLPSFHVGDLPLLPNRFTGLIGSCQERQPAIDSTCK